MLTAPAPCQAGWGGDPWLRGGQCYLGAPRQLSLRQSQSREAVAFGELCTPRTRGAAALALTAPTPGSTRTMEGIFGGAPHTYVEKARAV